MAEDKIEEQKKPEVSIKFVYFFCNDIAEVQAFYTGLLGMDEQSYQNDDEWGWLMYNCGSFQFIVFRSADELPKVPDWAAQPGWGGGELGVPSWSIEIPDKKFAEMVQKLLDAGVPAFGDKPMWCQDSYWSFPVRDPMGNTVEVYTSPAERPESTEWPD